MKILFAFLTALAPVGFTAGDSASASTDAVPGAEQKIPLVFTGGYETDPRDRGRPVVLVAAGLGVPSDVFRQAFRGVHPAPAGTQPQEDQVGRNKQVLLEALGPYGVTDDRLNQVSNFYRYRRDRGELWRHAPAEAWATIRHGAVTEITITNPGYGYSSPPAVSVPGYETIHLTATLAFGSDLAKNGSIERIETAKP